MGALLIDSSTKGFIGLTAVSAQDTVDVEKGEVSPALAKLLDAFQQVSSAEGPTEVVIGVFGKETQHVFSVQLEDLAEIQEILQWTIGRE